MTDLAWLTIAEAAGLLKARKLSPVEYADALLARIGAIDPRLNAFILLTADAARAEARAAEAEIAAGNWRGPMHGVPYGLKDIIDYAGLPTTAHSKILIDNLATSDAFVTARLKAAGGVHLGKLATHEFAIGGPLFDVPWPPARNPWNRNHHPGGSSSGSGAALASGMMPAALGTDTGGSVRNPASMCGIVGLKPTYGRVSRRGVAPLSFSLDHVGPMTRTVRDNAILLNVIAGYDPNDPGSADEPVTDYTHGLDGGVKGLKIGVIRHFYNRDMIARQDMGGAIEQALVELEKLGSSIVEVSVPPLQDYMATNRTILACEAYAVHEKWLKERPQDYGAITRERLMPGAFYRAVDYIQALRTRAILTDKMNAAFAGVDVLITASSMEPACIIDDKAETTRTYPRQARQAINVTGNPAIAVLTGFSSDNMPLAMQIIGKPFDEAMVLRVAHAFERATEWHTRRAPAAVAA
jgi:aspartyl-tRNA(Asn)/glutamyl-tRNA(Gln) amidotransferase subunit A